MIWMHILMVLFQIVLHSMYIFILSGYYSWGHDPFHWWLHKQYGCVLLWRLGLCASQSLLTEKSSPFDVIPLSSHELQDFFNIYISSYLFTVMFGAIIAINHLIIYAPLEWIMPFFSTVLVFAREFEHIFFFCEWHQDILSDLCPIVKQVGVWR